MVVGSEELCCEGGLELRITDTAKVLGSPGENKYLIKNAERKVRDSTGILGVIITPDQVVHGEIATSCDPEYIEIVPLLLYCFLSYGSLFRLDVIIQPCHANKGGLHQFRCLALSHCQGVKYCTCLYYGSRGEKLERIHQHHFFFFFFFFSFFFLNQVNLFY